MSEKQSLDNEAVEKKPPKYGFGVRHIQTLLMFLSVATGYIMRADMSFAVIAMTDNSTTLENVQTFPWNKQIQGVILSSFYWGYPVMQIPGGQLAHRYGVKILIVTAMLVNGFTTIATPWAASIGGWKALCACRIIQGLTQAAIFPCIHTFTSKWIPNSERSRLGNFMFTGTSIGIIVSMPLSTLLMSTPIGWPFIFYAIGTFGVLIGLFMWWYGAETPQSHKSISDKEKKYIEASLKSVEKKKVYKTPWKSIFTSLPVLAIAVTHSGLNWGFLIFMTYIPTYFKSALGIDLKKSGLLSALPYSAMWLGSIALSFVSDYIVNKNICSTIAARRIFNSIASWGPAIGLICLGFLPAGNEVLAIVILTITVGLISGMNMGYMMNHIDLSPNFGGTLMGITNCIANVIGGLAPTVLGYILEDDTDLMQWRIVFCSTAAVFFFTNLFFIIFLKCDRQKWNEPNKNIEIEMEESKTFIGKKSTIK